MNVCLPKNLIEDCVSLINLCNLLGVKFSDCESIEKTDIYEYEGEWPNIKLKYLGKSHSCYRLK